MPPNPLHPLTRVEKLVYGEDGVRHPISGYCIERGYGALSPDLQAEMLHLPAIERAEGKAAADAIRRKLQAATSPLHLVKESPSPLPPSPQQ